LGYLAGVQAERGDHGEARRNYGDALTLAETLANPRIQGLWLMCLATLDREASIWERAHQRFDAALGFMRHAEDIQGIGRCLSEWAVLNIAQDQLDKARVRLVEAEALLEQVSDAFGIAMLLCYRVELELQRGYEARARRALEHARVLAVGLELTPDAKLSQQLAAATLSVERATQP